MLQKETLQQVTPAERPQTTFALLQRLTQTTHGHGGSYHLILVVEDDGDHLGIHHRHIFLQEMVDLFTGELRESEDMLVGLVEQLEGLMT